jgi:hypothetical protein
MEAGKPAGQAADGRRRTLRWGIVALALVVGLIAWVATQGDDGGGSESEASSAESEASSAGFEARIVSEDELADIASSSGHAVYWVGPLPGKELEASESEDGSVTVRYLDEGAEPGGDRAGVLTIGSYPLPDPAGALEGFAEREGAIVREAEDGSQVVSSVEAPSSVYFASPDAEVQVEVYDPSPERAMDLALSGQVQPVD